LARPWDPLRQLSNEDVRYGFYGLRTVNTRANLLRVGTVLEEAALDKYSFTRDVFLQRRRSSVYDGEPPEEAQPEGR
jgi:phospholipid-binding lipoprotein MlaA